jgi:HK97 family phage major capsid protein
MTFAELDNTDQSVASTRHGGIITFWGNEGAEKTKSKLKFKENNYRLHKLFALVPVTDELLEDTVALESRINSKAGAAMIDTVNQAIIAGNGVGKPQGIIGSTRTVISPTDANRTDVAPITVAGLTGMFDRLLGGINPSWLINQELRSAISRLKIGDIPVMSGGNLQGVPFNFILGMPVTWTDICKKPSITGDIILSNFAGYEAITKGGVQSAVSIHLYFDQDITAFRFVFRIDGKPAIGQPTKPLNGDNDLSDFVTLAKTV